MLSVEEILEDMETFRAEKLENPDVRRLQEPESTSLEEWWKLFETFQRDVEHMKDIRVRLEELKTHLREKSKKIREQSNEIHEEIEKNLEEISLFEEEIKMRSQS
ncbi:uncharacterized protein LOC129789192 [Lutzomyia longipalpis]|uniref:uncharacterized protein LOC129789192 n=1 Tax=Lutzomyia longipalpis TaxID=7200 RepID=UPI0024846810|nr:uncharacterized protein LOC129789192 [Lutzomyia longipalpis]